MHVFTIRTRGTSYWWFLVLKENHTVLHNAQASEISRLQQD